MKKDWTGNKSTGFIQTGINYKTHGTNPDRGEDFYASPPTALEDLLKKENFENVWECACGEGHLARVLEEKNLLGKATDLFNRGYGTIENFRLSQEKWNGDIITNPPYRYAQEFVEKALDLISEGNKVAMLLKIQFLEGKKRAVMFKKYPPQTIYIWSGRISCALNGDFEKIKHGSPMMFAWFVWQKGFIGYPIIKWIN